MMQFTEKTIRKNISAVLKQKMQESELSRLIKNTILLVENPRTDYDEKKSQGVKAAKAKNAEEEAKAAKAKKEDERKKEEEQKKFIKQQEKEGFEQPYPLHPFKGTQLEKNFKAAKKFKAEKEKSTTHPHRYLSKEVEDILTFTQNLQVPPEKKSDIEKLFNSPEATTTDLQNAGKKLEKIAPDDKKADVKKATANVVKAKKEEEKDKKKTPTKGEPSARQPSKGKYKNTISDIQKNLGNHFKGEPTGKWGNTDQAWSSWVSSNKAVIIKNFFPKTANPGAPEKMNLLKTSWSKATKQIGGKGFENFDKYKATPKSMLQFILDVNELAKNQPAESEKSAKKPAAKTEKKGKQKYNLANVRVVDVNGNFPKLSKDLLEFAQEIREDLNSNMFIVRLRGDGDSELKRTKKANDTQIRWPRKGQGSFMKKLKNNKKLYNELNGIADDLKIDIVFKKV